MTNLRLDNADKILNLPLNAFSIQMREIKETQQRSTEMN